MRHVPSISSALIAACLSVFTIAVIAGAFTATERTTIQAMKARITALESAQAALEANQVAMAADIDMLDANVQTLAADSAALDAGLKGLVAEDGPLAALNANDIALDARLDEHIPAIALTGINPIVTCTTTTCTVQVEWFSDPPATGQVEWGPTTSYGNKTRLETGLLPYHKQMIGTFPADGKVYHFRILAGDTASPSTGFVAS